jgi:hypothetical protein
MSSAPETPPHFYAVSVVKLLLLNLATAGLYQIYWFYQHWQVIRARTGDRLSPPLRALFNVFFVYPLFRRIAADAPPGQVSPILLALVYVAIGVASLSPLPDPWSLIVVLAILPLLEVQSQANLVNAERTPSADANRRFTWGNVIGITAGAAAWTVVISGMIAAQRDPGSPLNLKLLAMTASEGLPRATIEGVKLIEVGDASREITYTYLVADEAVTRFRNEPFRTERGALHVQEACGRPELRRLLDAGVTLRHLYRSRTSETLLKVAVTRASCQPPSSPRARVTRRPVRSSKVETTLAAVSSSMRSTRRPVVVGMRNHCSEPDSQVAGPLTVGPAVRSPA